MWIFSTISQDFTAYLLDFLGVRTHISRTFSTVSFDTGDGLYPWILRKQPSYLNVLCYFQIYCAVGAFLWNYRTNTR